jgi:lysylphosphatidylglycerol synthetase-like protein (DUF2156 family)
MLLLLPPMFFLLGTGLGYSCASRFNERIPSGNIAIVVACVLLVCSALAANSTQLWWDLGFSYEVIRVAEGLSVFLFALLLGGTWRLLYPSKKRWLLLATVPLGLAQTLLSGAMFAAWAIKGFAP